MGVLKYVIVGVVVVVVVAALTLLPTLHRTPMQYVGSPSGYEAFVPHDTITYNGHTDPEGDLILNNGNTIHDVVWDGQYANTIIQNHNQIVQLNNQFKGEMQDFYIIKGQVPIEQATINGQTYIVMFWMLLFLLCLSIGILVSFQVVLLHMFLAYLLLLQS